MKFTPCSAVIRKVILPGTANFLSASIFSLCSRCRVNPFQMKFLISLNILFLLLLNPPLPSNDTSFFLKDRISCSTHLSISVVPYRIISIMVTDFWPAMALMLTFHVTRQMKEPSSMKAKKVTMQFISIGLINWHSSKYDGILQEINAHMIMYNFCELVTSHAVVKTSKNTKHVYKINFATIRAPPYYKYSSFVSKIPHESISVNRNLWGF